MEKPDLNTTESRRRRLNRSRRRNLVRRIPYDMLRWKRCQYAGSFSRVSDTCKQRNSNLNTFHINPLYKNLTYPRQN